MTKIILLNGVGSVGKSSIAKALQTITTETFLHVSMDAFMDMMPAASFEHPDGVTFETIQEDGKPSVVIRTGPVAERVFRGMRHAVAAMAAQGNNMILDEVLLDGREAGIPRASRPLRAPSGRRLRAPGGARSPGARARGSDDRPGALAIRARPQGYDL